MGKINDFLNRVSPTPALPAVGELAVIAPALPSVSIELLPPRKRTVSVTRQGMTTDDIEELIGQHVADTLATYETNQNTKNSNGNGNGSGSQSNNGSGGRRTMHTARGCTYKEFLNCQPLNFKGTKGDVGLA
ncbi:hypothetical protein Tco_0868423 [Tanacetum coccineum]